MKPRHLPALSLAALPLALLCATGARAQEADWCRNGLFPTEPPFRLAEVMGAERLHFLDDADGCPDKAGGDDPGACRTRSYVVPGDVVVVNREHGDYLCAFYPSKGGGTAGWVEAVRLQLLAVDAKPPLAAWTGTWTSAGNPEVTIREQGGALRIVGQAFWPGPKATRAYPSPHVGEIDGTLAVQGNRADYADEDLCAIAFTLLGDRLVAGDNRQCGGANVSFSAVYTRKAAKRR